MRKSSGNMQQVEAIRDGTVIDHIPAGQGVKILAHLHLLNSDARITVGFNLPSKTTGVKDLIKVESLDFTGARASELAVFAPGATINKIRNYKVTGKAKLVLPEEVYGIFDCPDSNCITHDEPVTSRFTVSGSGGNTRFTCYYCEKAFPRDIISGV